jgi:2-dehydropantoate 2-reductase
MTADLDNPVNLKGWRIAIVGCGAVGAYYGARLARLGRDVHFLARADYWHVREYGWVVNSHVDGQWIVDGDQVYRRAEDIGPVDLVIIGLKATANYVLPEVLPPLLHERTRILTLQNGLGNEEFLATFFGAERILGGLCFVCNNRTGPGRIEHLAEGMIQLGEFGRPPGPVARAIARDWEESRVPCKVVESLRMARWRKLVWNVPFNGLAIAAGGITTDLIVGSAELREAAAGLMEEIISLAAAEGHFLPEGLVEDQITRTAAMAAYRPSSLIDFQNGVAVELEAIWQAPLRVARELGVPTPRLQMLTGVLEQLVASG